MDIKTQIQKDRIEALKLGQTQRKATLDYILGEIQKKEKDPNAKGDVAVAVIKAYIKSLREFIDAHRSERPEVCRQYEEEIELLTNYLPRQLSEAELRAEIEALRSSGVDKKGLIIKALKEKHGASVDGKLASEILESMGLR